MKKLVLALLTAAALTFTSVASADVEGRGYRIVIEQSIANDTQVVLSELEFLGEVTYDVDSVVSGAGGSFGLSATGVGDVTDQFPVGSIFTIADSTGNDGSYTVGAVAYSSGTNVTTITVEDTDTILDSTADGTITTADEVDVTRGDRGISACGWTREAPNTTGNLSTFDVGCDSVASDQTPTSVPSGVRRTRVINKVFNDSFADEFITDRVINETNGTWTVQYTIYIGSSAPGRTVQSVDAYTVTVPSEYVGPGEDGLAPSIWQVEYLDSTSGKWVVIDEVEAANFNDGYAVDSEGRTSSDAGFTTEVGRQLRFTL